MSTSSLIRPSYIIKATIFEKVFWPEKFPKTEHFGHLSGLKCEFSSSKWVKTKKKSVIIELRLLFKSYYSRILKICLFLIDRAELDFSWQKIIRRTLIWGSNASFFAAFFFSLLKLLPLLPPLQAQTCKWGSNSSGEK